MTGDLRDFAGYAGTPPEATSEAFLSEIVGAAPWHGQRHWNMESIYDYGARAGFWRLH